MAFPDFEKDYTSFWFAGISSWQPRYYQDLAIQRTLEAIAKNEDRILLTLVTGTA